MLKLKILMLHLLNRDKYEVRVDLFLLLLLFSPIGIHRTTSYCYEQFDNQIVHRFVSDTKSARCMTILTEKGIIAMGECLIIRSGGGTDTSGATATANVILSGYTAYVNDEKVTGTMPVQTLNQTLNPGGSVTLPAGYYEEGANVISASALSGATAGTAAASHILSGYNAWVNGSKINGSMVNRGNISHSLPANGSYTIPAGWHAGGGVVNQSLAFHWGGTYTPNTANQVICWANWYAAGNIVVAGNGNLVAGNIRNGITIFGIRGTFVGWTDSTLDFFTWNSNIPITTNLQNTQLTLQGSDDLNDHFAYFFRAKSSFATAGDSTFMNDVNRANVPITQFKKLKVSFTGSVNPNGTGAYIWARPWVAVQRNGWKCVSVGLKTVGAGKYQFLRLSFGNGRDWVTESYEQIYDLPLDIEYVGGGIGPATDYSYANGHYSTYSGTIVGFTFYLDKDYNRRTVWGSMSNLKIVYTN